LVPFVAKKAHHLFIAQQGIEDLSIAYKCISKKKGSRTCAEPSRIFGHTQLLFARAGVEEVAAKEEGVLRSVIVMDLARGEEEVVASLT